MTKGKGKRGDDPSESMSSFFEEMERQMKAYQRQFEKEGWHEMAKAGFDFARISTKHMADMFSRISECLPESMSPVDAYQKAKEIYTICASSYSNMFKEAMGTSSIPLLNARMLESLLDWKIESDRANHELLKSFGVPTQRDMDEIAEKIYWLDKKIDKISKQLSHASEKPRKSRKG